MSSNFFLVAWTLLQRETVRFVRQKNRIVGALGTPLVFWFLIGSGLKNSFHSAAFSSGARQIDYLQYFFPGTVVLILLFTAIFSTISVIEDRREGFLQGVLVAPISRSAMVFGNLLGGTVLATAQGLLFVALAPFLGLSLTLGSFLFLLLAILLMSFGLTGLGFILAWQLDSTQGFHALMNLFLMPLWLLSGALFPLEGVPTWLHRVMILNPLTYSVAALQQGLYVGSAASNGHLPSPAVCLGITFIFSAATFLGAIFVGSKNRVLL